MKILLLVRQAFAQLMGAGTNRINIYTVASAAKGLAACLQASDASEEGVIVCYDSQEPFQRFC